MPSVTLERQAGCLVAGVDEAGRGPLAGPVVAAAVILPLRGVPRGIDDSKVLRAEARERLYARIEQCAIVGIGAASVEEIDRINILEASLLAMRRAVLSMPVQPRAVLIDGNQLPDDLPCPARAIVDGDAISRSIAAASIIAKVVRDRIMDSLAQSYPGYGWEHNRGYATADHRGAILKLGVTAHHRRTFAAVRLALEGNLQPELPFETAAAE
ncbi:MAG: ribonuclease HII [Alphaproteobacteria bacterium]|nr:ribonuclease HII [Alphaproteobacteria bacterium]